jgi:hypothetical protein
MKLDFVHDIPATGRLTIARDPLRPAGNASTVTGMGIIALDLGLRGAATGLFLMIMAVILIRTRPLTTIKLLGSAMAIGTAAYLIATAPFVPKSTLWWTLPILAANPALGARDVR